MNYENEPGLSPTIVSLLQQYDDQRELMKVPAVVVAGTLPPEIPIEPGTTVAMPMALYFRDNEEERDLWRGSGMSAVGLVAGVNYGHGQGEARNHWRYHVVWQHEGWKLTRPDGKVTAMKFNGGPGAPGWPHPWRHDMLVAMRGLPGLRPEAPPS